MRVALFTALLVVIDQATKHLAVTRLKPHGSVPVINGLFNLSYVENSGAAWGMLAGRQYLLVSFSIVTLAFLVWRRRHLFDHLRLAPLTMTLICGGIVGNLIDRIRHAYVIDFLDFHWHGAHFPAFNVADAAICCGVFLFMATQWHHDLRKGGGGSPPPTEQQ
ncbi:MAG: signal peptidase II [Kiritimatiellae bacterium]|nr:signal peptidase II [Kiritimatiellia bacterium]